VRGTIERVDGTTYIVKTRAGETAEDRASPTKPLFVAIVKASMGRHQAGHLRRRDRDFPNRTASLRAVEVHIFPEGMRGTGEGHRPSDLAPQATMTNATGRGGRGRRERPQPDDEVQRWRERPWS